MFNPSILIPGDCILYKPSDVVGLIIAIKTWSWTAHIEGYIGNNQSIAARDTGVNTYPLRNDKYAKCILRPKISFDFNAAMDWYDKCAKGDKYDFEGLFGFFIPDKFDKDDSTVNYKKFFCSMLVDMWYVHGNFRPFAVNAPANKISPAQFLESPLFNVVWEDR